MSSLEGKVAVVTGASAAYVEGRPGKMAIAKQECDRLKSHCTSQLYRANVVQAQVDLAGDTIIRAPIEGGGVPIMQLIIQAKLAERRKTFHEE